MGELRGRAAAVQLAEPALVFAGRALSPLPKQLYRLYSHIARHLSPKEDFLPRASGRTARFDTEKRAYLTERGPLTAAAAAVVIGRARLPRVGEAVFFALADKAAPEDWAHALVFRSGGPLARVYGHLKRFHAANPGRFRPDGFTPHPVARSDAMRAYRACFPVTVFDLEMNDQRPIQFAGRRLTAARDGSIEEETLSLYVRQPQKLSPYVAELTRLTDAFLRRRGIPEPEAAKRIYDFLARDGCFAGNALHNDLLSLRGMFARCGLPIRTLRRGVIDLTQAVRFDRGETNESSLRHCMEYAGLSFAADKFHDAAYDTEGAARLFQRYLPDFIEKYGRAPVLPWYFFEPMREKSELDQLYAETYVRPPRDGKDGKEGKARGGRAP